MCTRHVLTSSRVCTSSLQVPHVPRHVPSLPLITDFAKDLSYSLRISVSPLNVGNIRRIVGYPQSRKYFPQLPDDVRTPCATPWRLKCRGINNICAQEARDNFTFDKHASLNLNVFIVSFQLVQVASTISYRPMIRLLSVTCRFTNKTTYPRIDIFITL